MARGLCFSSPRQTARESLISRTTLTARAAATSICLRAARSIPLRTKPWTSVCTSSIRRVRRSSNTPSAACAKSQPDCSNATDLRIATSRSSSRIRRMSGLSGPCRSDSVWKIRKSWSISTATGTPLQPRSPWASATRSAKNASRRATSFFSFPSARATPPAASFFAGLISMQAQIRDKIRMRGNVFPLSCGLVRAQFGEERFVGLQPGVHGNGEEARAGGHLFLRPLAGLRHRDFRERGHAAEELVINPHSNEPVFSRAEIRADFRQRRNGTEVTLLHGVRNTLLSDLDSLRDRLRGLRQERRAPEVYGELGGHGHREHEDERRKHGPFLDPNFGIGYCGLQ